MFDIILTIILVILSIVISTILNLENAALQALIELVPIAIITIRLWYNRPRNYIRLLGVVNKNIKYHMTIKLEECNIDNSFYLNLRDELLGLYGKKNGKVINQNTGEYLWRSYLEIDSCLIEINYNLEDGCMYFETKSKTKFRNFINDVGKVIMIISNLFSSDCCNHETEVISIDLVYLSRNQEDIKHPLISKFFEGFNNMSFRMKYNGKQGSLIEISNRGVNISGNNLDDIKKDIRNEMLLF